jgi:DHA1 family inner membrane transport protein
MAGYTLAFLVGMPVGSVLGDTFGWRAAFWFAAAIALSGSLVISLLAPRNISAPKLPGMTFRSALVGDNPKIMAVSLLAFIATFATVSFIGPVITESTGVQGAAIGGIQIATGLGSLLGLPLGAALARLKIKDALTILLSATLVTQFLFTFGMINDYGWAAIPALVITMSLGSAALFATLPIIQARLTITSGHATTIALALNGSMVYFGQGLGSTIGGSVIASIGVSWTGAAGVTVAIIALILISRIHNS